MKIKKYKDIKSIISNKKVFFNYSIEKKIDAGIVLKSWEVKSLRLKKVNIDNSYVFLKNGEAYLSGTYFEDLFFIPSIKDGSIRKNYQKLLLKKKEIEYLHEMKKKVGYTVIVISFFWKKNWIKVTIGVAKGKKIKDKRKDIKDKEWEIKKARILKKRNL